MKYLLFYIIPLIISLIIYKYLFRSEEKGPLTTEFILIYSFVPGMNVLIIIVEMLTLLEIRSPTHFGIFDKIGKWLEE